MRTVHFRSLALAAIAALTFAGSVAAQERAVGLLNTLEVRQLVARAGARRPGTTQRSLHRTRWSVRDRGEAALSMSQSVIGNPSRNLGTGMSAHCKQLANLNTQSETTVRELAAYYARLASGTPATSPKTELGSRAAPVHPNPQRKS